MNSPMTSPSRVLASSPTMARSGAICASCSAPSTVLWSVRPMRSRPHSWLRAIRSSRELWPSCEKREWRWRSTRISLLKRGRPIELALARPCEQRDHLGGTAAQTRLLHERGLGVVDDLHHVPGAALASKSGRQLGVRLPEDDHEARHQPARHQTNLLDEALFDPEEKLIALLKHSAWCHRTPPSAMPVEIALLLFNRLLKHGS